MKWKKRDPSTPCLYEKSITSPSYGAHTITYILQEFSGKSHKINDRETGVGARAGVGGIQKREMVLLNCEKINKHVWAYSLQQETPQWESFLAESQQEMKDNPTLNTCVGTYHLSFPIMGGQSCYELIAEVWLPLSLSLSLFYKKSYTNAWSICTLVNHRTLAFMLLVGTHLANLNVPFTNINTAIFESPEWKWNSLSVLLWENVELPSRWHLVKNFQPFFIRWRWFKSWFWGSTWLRKHLFRIPGRSLWYFMNQILGLLGLKKKYCQYSMGALNDVALSHPELSHWENCSFAIKP